MIRRRRQRGSGLRALVLAAGCALFPAFAYAPAAHAADTQTSGSAIAASMEGMHPRPSTALTTRRMLIALIALIGGFALSLHGWGRIATGRRWRGAALMVSGWTLGICALTLIRLSENPDTWNWWI